MNLKLIILSTLLPLAAQAGVINSLNCVYQSERGQESVSISLDPVTKTYSGCMQAVRVNNDGSPGDKFVREYSNLTPRLGAKVNAASSQYFADTFAAADQSQSNGNEVGMYVYSIDVNGVSYWTVAVDDPSVAFGVISRSFPASSCEEK